MEYCDVLFDSMKRNYPDVAREAKEYFSLVDRQLHVLLTDGTKVVYDANNKTMRFFSPEKKCDISVFEDEYDWKMKFVENLIKLMEERGVSRRELSEKTGIAYQTIYSYTTGRSSPSCVNIAKISEVIGYPIESFFTFFRK